MSRKLIASGLALVAAASVVGGATYAQFTETITSPVQSVTAGTFDIDFADTNSANSAIGFPVNISNAKPGDSGGSQMLHVVNSGSVPASVAVKIKKTNDAENGCNAVEAAAEPGCAADLLGELDSNMTVGINGYVGVESVLAGLAVGQSALVKDLNGTQYDSVFTLQPGADRWLNVAWGVNLAAGNNVQSDSVGFEVIFEATQL